MKVVILILYNRVHLTEFSNKTKGGKGFHKRLRVFTVHLALSAQGQINESLYQHRHSASSTQHESGQGRWAEFKVWQMFGFGPRIYDILRILTEEP